MVSSACYEQYPLLIILISNSLSFAVYLVGAFLMFQVNLILLILYLLFIVVLEARVLRGSCTRCYYYGKACAFGKGKVSALIFERKPANDFGKEVTWKSVLPDFLVAIVPIAAGIGLMIFSFDLLVLASVVLLAILSTIGNGVVRGSYACKFCKQRELGCPAEKLFSKGKSES